MKECQSRSYDATNKDYLCELYALKIIINDNASLKCRGSPDVI